jgi:MYXO-CTERM domain-containing protein
MRGDPNHRILLESEESPAVPLLALALFGLVGAGLVRRRA